MNLEKHFAFHMNCLSDSQFDVKSKTSFQFCLFSQVYAYFVITWASKDAFPQSVMMCWAYVSKMCLGSQVFCSES